MKRKAQYIQFKRGDQVRVVADDNNSPVVRTSAIFTVSEVMNVPCDDGPTQTIYLKGLDYIYLNNQLELVERRVLTVNGLKRKVKGFSGWKSLDTKPLEVKPIELGGRKLKLEGK